MMEAFARSVESVPEELRPAYLCAMVAVPIISMGSLYLMGRSDRQTLEDDVNNRKEESRLIKDI